MPVRSNISFLILSILFSLLVSNKAEAQGNNLVSLRTVVIDAGHGGSDPGTISSDKHLKESRINLDIALALGKMIEDSFPEVRVLYTRKTDIFIPLDKRASIANKNHADLFISIHVNSARKSTSASGTETFVMGTDRSESNMDVCRRENSVILLEDDYSTKYQGFDPDNTESYIIFNLMQNASLEQSILMASLVQQNLQKGPVVKNRGIKQAPLVVLWQTTMPSVLIETGFLSNTSDRKILSEKSGREKIAGRIFDAFSAFKREYDSHLQTETEDVPVIGNEEIKTSDGESSVTSGNRQSFYMIQIFAVRKKLADSSDVLRDLGQYECRYADGLYKYYVGNFASREEAAKKLTEIRKKYKGAFVVPFEYQ